MDGKRQEKEESWGEEDREEVDWGWKLRRVSGCKRGRGLLWWVRKEGSPSSRVLLCGKRGFLTAK